VNFWGGFVIAELMELDAGIGLGKGECSPDQKRVRNRIANMLTVLERNGAISRVIRKDDHRHDKPFYSAAAVVPN
jgi:hypothetical protein